MRAGWAFPMSSRPPSTRPTAPRRAASAARASSRGWPCSKACAGSSTCRCSPTCTKTRRWPKSPRWSTCCRPRRSCAGRPISSRPWRAAGRPVNIKKGQFLSPWEMPQVVEKARATGNADIMVCERGFSFGYNNLVADMRSLAVMRATGCPGGVRCHAFGAAAGRAGAIVRRPARVRAGAGARGGGRRRRGRVHGNASRPDKALSDGPNAWPLARMESLLATLVELDRIVKSRPL